MITRKALKKWTGITAVCGAQSFFWGVMIQSSVAAMLLGMVTLILLFSLIESHPAYQVRRAVNAAFARAMDWGIRLRLILGFYSPLVILLDQPLRAVFGPKLGGWMAMPALGDIYLGTVALEMTRWLTGVNMSPARNVDANGASVSLPYLERFAGTYMTTVFTGLMHTAVLALLCGVVYIVIRLRQRKVRVDGVA